MPMMHLQQGSRPGLTLGVLRERSMATGPGNRVCGHCTAVDAESSGQPAPAQKLGMAYTAHTPRQLQCADVLIHEPTCLIWTGTPTRCTEGTHNTTHHRETQPLQAVVPCFARPSGSPD